MIQNRDVKGNRHTLKLINIHDNANCQEDLVDFDKIQYLGIALDYEIVRWRNIA